MEISIKKYSEIGLILFELLHDYDCTMICIQTLKNEEKNDTIKYNIERYKNKPTKFTYRFLLTLYGSVQDRHLKKRRKRIINKYEYVPVITTPKEVTKAMKCEDLINKYDEILDIPDISDKQKVIILTWRDALMANIYRAGPWRRYKIVSDKQREIIFKIKIMRASTPQEMKLIHLKDV